jgi:peptidoglycan/LPS O-acetylase OafA/YrhL
VSATLPVSTAAALPKAGKGVAQLSGHIPELDGIRGLAIGMVVFYHYAIQTFALQHGSVSWYVLLPGRLGWTGVDLFFVLSGFLIGGILLDARNSPNYFQVFYRRRFFRIVPAYALFFLCFLSLSWLNKMALAPKLDWITQNPLPWYSYVLFLQNFWMAFGNVWGPPVTSITWSLAVEEQFYLTLPWLLRRLNRKRLVQVLLEGILLAPLLRLALYSLWPRLSNAWFVLMPCRMDALLFGVVAAIALREPSWKLRLENHRKLLRLGLVFAGALVPLLTQMYFEPYGFPTASLGLTCIAVFYVILLVYVVVFKDSRLSRCLRWSWLRWLGGLAYGIYLFHQLILYIIYGLIWSSPPFLSGFQQCAVCVLGFAVTLAVCQLSYKLFEKPLIRIGHLTAYGSEGR